MTNNRESWIIRLKEEAKEHMEMAFVTLTYNDESLVYGGADATLVPYHLQLYLKTLRKSLSPLQIRFFGIGEYGENSHRPHYHLLLFGIGDDERIRKAWKRGYVHIGTVTEASITYVSKFHILKTEYPEGSCKPFARVSKKLGANYFKKMATWHNKDTMRNFYQHWEFKKPLPRYYKEKMFNHSQCQEIGERNVKLCDEKEVREFIEWKETHPYDNYFIFQEQKKQAYQENFKLKNKVRTL